MPSRKPNLIEISGPELNLLHNKIDPDFEGTSELPISPAYASTNTGNNTQVIVLNFDGTENNSAQANKNPLRDKSTLIYEISEQFWGGRGERIRSYYYPGVGTSSKLNQSAPGGVIDLVPKWVESAKGIGCKERAETALKDVQCMVDGFPDRRIHLHITGFSRGGASALHFMNLIHEQSIGNQKAGLTPMTAMLVDVVATGQHENLKLEVPPSVLSLLHIVADGDERFLFAVLRMAEKRVTQAFNVFSSKWVKGKDGRKSIEFTKVDDVKHKQVQIFRVPGARHSDAGGAYTEGGFHSYVKYVIDSFHASLGLPLKDAPLRPGLLQVQSMKSNDPTGALDYFDRGIKRIKEAMPGIGKRAESRTEIVSKNRTIYKNNTDVGQIGQQSAANLQPIFIEDMCDLRQQNPEVTSMLRSLNEIEDSSELDDAKKTLELLRVSMPDEEFRDVVRATKECLSKYQNSPHAEDLRKSIETFLSGKSLEINPSQTQTPISTANLTPKTTALRSGPPQSSPTKIVDQRMREVRAEERTAVQALRYVALPANEIDPKVAIQRLAYLQPNAEHYTASELEDFSGVMEMAIRLASTQKVRDALLQAGSEHRQTASPQNKEQQQTLIAQWCDDYKLRHGDDAAELKLQEKAIDR